MRPIERHARRQDLDGDIPLQPRVVRAVHLAHAARSDGRQDLVRTQASSGSQGRLFAGQLLSRRLQRRSLQETFALLLVDQ